MHETLYLTMNLLDRYLSQVPVQKNEMQLIGLTALLLASKYEDYWHPRVRVTLILKAKSSPQLHMAYNLNLQNLLYMSMCRSKT